MDKELEESIKNLKQQLENIKTANECGLATKGEFKQDIKAIETVLNYIEILETAVNNKYPYVIGGRTLYAKLQQCNKEDLIKAYLRLRNKTEQLIKENSISKEKVKEIIKELNEEFYTLDKEIDVSEYGLDDRGKIFAMQEISWIIGKLQELLEEK